MFINEEALKGKDGNLWFYREVNKQIMRQSGGGSELSHMERVVLCGLAPS